MKLKMENVKWKILVGKIVCDNGKFYCPTVFKIAVKQPHTLIFNFQLSNFHFQRGDLYF